MQSVGSILPQSNIIVDNSSTNSRPPELDDTILNHLNNGGQFIFEYNGETFTISEEGGSYVARYGNNNQAIIPEVTLTTDDAPSGFIIIDGLPNSGGNSLYIGNDPSPDSNDVLFIESDQTDQLLALDNNAAPENEYERLADLALQRYDVYAKNHPNKNNGEISATELYAQGNSNYTNFGQLGLLSDSTQALSKEDLIYLQQQGYIEISEDGRLSLTANGDLVSNTEKAMEWYDTRSTENNANNQLIDINELEERGLTHEQAQQLISLASDNPNGGDPSGLNRSDLTYLQEKGYITISNYTSHIFVTAKGSNQLGAKSAFIDTLPESDYQNAANKAFNHYDTKSRWRYEAFNYEVTILAPDEYIDQQELIEGGLSETAAARLIAASANPDNDKITYHDLVTLLLKNIITTDSQGNILFNDNDPATKDESNSPSTQQDQIPAPKVRQPEST